MFKKINEIKKNKSEKENKNKKTIKVYKRPIFLIVGLIALVAVTIVIYMIFLNFKEIMRIEYDGYAISGKEITENLLGNSREEDKNLSLIPVREQDKLYKKLNSYFIGENKKDEINLEYPIYINNNSTIYNLSQNMVLITNKFEEIAGYPNLTATNGGIYNQSDLERMDNTEYIFLKNEDSIYTSLKDIKITTVANEYRIPLNSSIYFDKEAIRYYEIKDDKLIFKEIGDIDNNSKVQIGDKEVSYQELLTKLKILKEEKQDDNTEEVKKEDISKDNQTKNEEIKKEEKEETNKEEVVEGKYVKPIVTCSPFEAKVYTMSTELTIQDPSKVIQDAITFEIKRDGKVYLRKTYTSAGEIQIVGLEPNTNYEIEGKYIYLNEQGQKVENIFYRDNVTTKGLQELKPITLSFENGEIFANKVQIAKLKISSNITEEAVKGVKRAEIVIGNASYEIKSEKLKQMLAGQEAQVETNESLKSNQKISYEIKFYDKQENEMNLQNNKGESKTAKQKPSVSIRIAKQNVIDVTLGIKLNNKDRVEILNYRYVITKPNGDIVKESGLKESDSEIFLNDLDPNQYYSIKIYGDYDVNDNKGLKENQILGETIFATQPLSTLGYVNLEVGQQDVTTNSGKIEVKIEEEKTDKRLIQILKELKIQIINKGKNDVNIERKENEIISEIIVEGEELQNLKQGDSREESYENLESNTKYEIKITAKVSLGDTTEEIQTTYNLKEFITLKQPAEIQMRNLFVTGDMIDFDVRIEDIDNASLTGEVRMELRDEKQNLVKLEYIDTNKEYARKTFEKLELNKTYTLSFYTDQYNEGSTDSTYKANYLLKQMEIYTETGITGNIGLTDLSKKATGKNLVDMSSEIKWYVYPNFNTNDYYGKEYDTNTKTLTLGGHGNNRRAVYDLREYAGKTVTMSFKAKLVTEGSNGNTNYAYIQNKKTDGNRTKIEGLTTEKWKEYSYTMQLDDSGYLGFYIQGGNGVQLQELQIELGEQKTKYEEFESVQQGTFSISLQDKKDEIKTNDYYIKIYKNNILEKEERYEELNQTNEINNILKKFFVSSQIDYRVELSIKISDREYVLDTQELRTEDSKEIRGIFSKEEFLEIQPYGNYIVLKDIDFTKDATFNNTFGSNNMAFNGEINFNGTKLIRDVQNRVGPIFYLLGEETKIKNLVLDIKMNNKEAKEKVVGLFLTNRGEISNVQINLIEATKVDNINVSLLGESNYGIIKSFIINYQVPLYGARSLRGGVVSNKGIIKNGYVIGEGIKSTFNLVAGEKLDISNIANKNEINGTIQNIYVLSNFEVSKKENANLNIGIIANINQDLGLVENVYSTEIYNDINDFSNGPNIYQSTTNVKNNYYFSNNTFSNTLHTKTTKLVLYDVQFQKQMLNGENAFSMENIEKGYYPHLIMPDCMPTQEYINLPKVQDEDLPDILSIEVLEQKADQATVKFVVNNKMADTISEIKIKNLECKLDVESQKYENGQTEIIGLLQKPVLYQSNYSVSSITTKNKYNIPYTRTFNENERIIYIDLYRTISNIEEWKAIAKSPTENYMLMSDLDFINEGANVRITATYTGKINGNGHIIKNINLSNSLLKTFKGSIDNIVFDNIKIENPKENVGIIGNSQNAEINEVEVRNMNIVIGESYSGQLNVGGIVGNSQSDVYITNSRIINLKIISNVKIGTLSAGGIVGNSPSGVDIQNCYVQDFNMEIYNAIDYKGIGGILGVGESAYNPKSIKNCYAIGKIKTDSDYVGGIAGEVASTNIKNCYSKVDIQTSGKYVGGILGFHDTTKNEAKGYRVENCLAIGDIYMQVSDLVQRIVGNQTEETKNYAYEGQKINGKIDNNMDAILLSYQELLKESCYQTTMKWENYFDYSRVYEGILPKIMDKKVERLLPNQNDNRIKEEQKITLNQVEFDKKDMSTIQVQIQFNNEDGVEIKKVNIGDMDTNIVESRYKDGISYVILNAIPRRFYDSYQIESVTFTSEGKEESETIGYKLEVIFYKELYTYEDWQSIEENTYQNYRLMNDIDFKGKEGVKNNVNINRLESETEKHTLKNMNINLNGDTKGLFGNIKTSMKNIGFESITIYNSANGNYTGLIVNSNADLLNVTFNNIMIVAKDMNYVGIISNYKGNSIKNIEMNQIQITGKSYVAGFCAKIVLPDLDGLIANQITVTGEGNRVAGITSGIMQRKAQMKNIMVANANITGNVYVGGVIDNIGGGVAGGQIQNVIIKDSNIYGNSGVGGFAGWAYDCLNIYCENVKVIGYGQNIGGVAGYLSQVSAYVKNCYVEGTSVYSDNVGGIAGRNEWNGSDLGVENTIVKSKGSNVGGIYGLYEEPKQNHHTIKNTYTKDCIIEGYSNVGGIIGNFKGSYLYNNYTNSNIEAIAHSAGGIIGYLNNLGMTAVNNYSTIYSNYIVQNTIQSSNNVGGIVGNTASQIYNNGKNYYYNNLIQTNLISKDDKSTSMEFGGVENNNIALEKSYSYQYSKINEQYTKDMSKYQYITYLTEKDLKQSITYSTVLKWNSEWDLTKLVEEKYPTLKLKWCKYQEGIDLPKDSEHIVNAETGISLLSLEDEIEKSDLNSENKKEELQEAFEYNGKKIETYETYSVITNTDGTSIRREERLYVKDGKLYVIDGSLDMIVNNLIVDSYNGKEYETILGTDGKLYDLKDQIHYPENFRNEKIKTIGNNLHQEEKEITVIYEDGSKVTFNYQTGEVIEEQKVENNTSLLDYLKEQMTTGSNLIEDTKTSYEENKTLVSKLQITPIEKAVELKNNESINNTVEEQRENTTGSSNETSSITSENRGSYITVYNSSKKEFEVYKEEEILDVDTKEVVSENEKIEKNNLNEYYVQEERTEKETSGIVWVLLSITGAVIVLFILWKIR